MADDTLVTAYNNYYYPTMPVFNSSAIAGFPTEVQAVFTKLFQNINYIEDIATDLQMYPDKVFQILTQLEGLGLVAHGYGVSGRSGVMFAGDTNNDMLSPRSLDLSGLFDVERTFPVLNSSAEIEEMGQAEDKVMEQQAAKNQYQSPVVYSPPQIVAASPTINAEVPPIIGAPK